MSNVPDKEFKVMVTKTLTELGRRKEEHSKNFNKEIENIRKYQTEVTELKNTKTEATDTPEGCNNRLDAAEVQMRKLKDKQWDLPRQSSKKKKVLKK